MSIPDEEQPLLRQITEDHTKHDEVILDFEPMDPEDPRNWSPAFKWCIVLLLASMAFTVYVPVVFLDYMNLVATSHLSMFFFFFNVPSLCVVCINRAASRPISVFT